MRKPRLLFVAGLTPVETSGSGGQYTAATGLLNSPLASQVEILPLSSTMVTIPPPPLAVRLRGALQRLTRFFAYLAKADVVLVFSSSGWSVAEKGLMCMAARLAGRGVVLRLSSGAIPEQCKKSWFMRTWLRRALRSTHVLCSQGTFWTSYYQSFPEAAGKVVEVPNGVSVPPLVERAGAPSQARVTFVGWMYREKGIFEALEAFRTVLLEFPHATFTLAGGGKDFDAFQAEVAAAGLEDRVRSLGWIAPKVVPALLRETDVFLLPTHYEGMPNALLEAMAAGVPVVTTAVGSIPDLVRDGETGLFVPAGDAGAIAEAVTRLLRDPAAARRIGRAGYQAVRARYNIDTVWRIYAGALQRALDEARGRHGRRAGAGLASLSVAPDAGEKDSG